MGRYNRFGMQSRNQNGNRQSIGDHYVSEACKALDRACETEAAIFVSQRFAAETVIPWCFDPDTLDKARNVAGIVDPSSYDMAYELDGVGDGADLTIVFRRERNHDYIHPTIQPEFFKLQHPDCHPLLDAVETIRDIYFKWSGVKHMLRWFNREATPGAIRNYWPAVLKLCKTAPAFKEMFDTAPARFTAPPDIGMMLPLIRETATTVAGMALMPDSAHPHEGGNVHLTFNAMERSYLGKTIVTDEITFML